MTQTNVLLGKPLRYLIGADDNPPGHDGEITEVSYDSTQIPKHGIGVKYVNLFDEKNTGKFGPYLHTSDTAQQYGEGQPDPAGPGFIANLQQQLIRAKQQGFEYVELDNPDAYKIIDVLQAVAAAAAVGLKVIAKNPALVDPGMDEFVRNANVYGIIVEHGAGSPPSMDRLRRINNRPDLPVWFVAFNDGEGGHAWANRIAPDAHKLGMGVTYSPQGEYTVSTDVVKPRII